MSAVRVAVTGGSGFIGSNLVELLLGHEIALETWDIAAPRIASHDLVWRALDVMDEPSVRRAYAEFAPTHVVHLAARTDLHGSAPADYDVNVTGTANVLALAEAAGGVERVILASSRLVCRVGFDPKGETDYAPDTPYGASKMAMEMATRATETVTPWVIVRPTSIWGPWFGTPYRDFFTTIARGRYVHPRGMNIHKSFGFVGNTVEQLWRLLLIDFGLVKGRTLYLADYEPLDVLGFARLIASSLGAPSVRTVPVPLLRVIAEVGEGLHRLGVSEPPLTRFRLRNLLTPMVYDLEPTRKVLGELPHSLHDGVERTVKWLKDVGLV